MAGWDGWMASPTQWTWVWVNSGSWWWTGRPDVLRFMGSQRVGHDWATELNWTDSYVLQLDSHNISINSSFPLLYSDLQSHFPSIPVPLPTLFYEHYHLAHNSLLILFWQRSMYISCISTSFLFMHFLGTCWRYMHSVSLQGFHCSIYILPFMVTFMCISELLLISQLISSYFKIFTLNMIHYYYTCAF